MALIFIISIIIIIVVGIPICYIILDILCPITYNDVEMEGVEKHFEELYRRGFNNAKMYISGCASKRLFVVNKEIGARNTIYLNITILNWRSLCQSSRNDVKKYLFQHNINHFIRQKTVRIRYLVDVHGAMSIIKDYLSIMSVERDEKYIIYARGRIIWFDTLVYALNQNMLNEFIALGNTITLSAPYTHSHKAIIKKMRKRGLRFKGGKVSMHNDYGKIQCKFMGYYLKMYL